MSDILPAAILDAFRIGCVILDSAGKIAQANDLAAARVHRAPRDFVGESFFSVFGLTGGKAAFEAELGAAAAPASVKIDFDLTDAVVRVRGFEHAGATFALAVFERAHSDVRMRRVGEAWNAALEVVREVRHEINNPLMGILGQLELLQARSDLTAPVAKKLASIEYESNRIRVMAARLGEIKRV